MIVMLGIPEQHLERNGRGRLDVGRWNTMSIFGTDDLDAVRRLMDVDRGVVAGRFG